MMTRKVKTSICSVNTIYTTVCFQHRYEHLASLLNPYRIVNFFLNWKTIKVYPHNQNLQNSQESPMSHCFVLGAYETTQTPFILVRIQPVTFTKIFFLITECIKSNCVIDFLYEVITLIFMYTVRSSHFRDTCSMHSIRTTRKQLDQHSDLNHLLYIAREL